MVNPSVENIVCNLCTEKNPVFRAFFTVYVLRSGLSGHRLIKDRLMCILLDFNGIFPQDLDTFLHLNGHLRFSLVSDLIKGGGFKHAIALYKELRKKHDFILDKYDFLSLVKVCTELKDMETSYSLYDDVVSKKGLLSFLGNAMVNMYAKCGMLRTAQEVFDQIPVRDVVSWNSLIIGYARDEDGEKALDCFELMQIDGVSPDAITYVSSLKACGSIGDVEKGRELEVAIGSKGLLVSNLIVGNALIDMYARCGMLEKAREVFENLKVRDIISWNTIITGYTKHEKAEMAFLGFKEMELEGFSPNSVTYVCILKLCGLVRDIHKGIEVHDNIGRKWLVERNLIIGNALIDMYAKCGFLAKAKEVFNILRVRDINSWNALISGYADLEQFDEALLYFKEMQLAGVLPDAVTYVSILKACGSTQDELMGIQIHAEVSRRGLESMNLVLGSTLVDMYVKLGCLLKAREVFNVLPIRDVILWNTLMGGYATHECGKVLDCFNQMELEGFSPNSITFSHCLKACGSIINMEKGMEIHGEIIKKGLLKQDQIVSNALIGMYVKCGMLAEAQEVFDKLLVRDVVSWTTLITGYTKQNFGKEALKCFEQMQLEGNSPDIITMACSLNACISVGAGHKGEEYFTEIAKTGLLEKDVFIGCALVNMYAKCGLLSNAQDVFDNLPVRDTVLWNALISGYSACNQENEASNCFEHMQIEGVSPDITTYACILKLLGNAGAIQKGQKIHLHIGEKKLLQENNIFLANTLVDMYAKCGYLAKAQELFNKLPARNIISWNALITGYVAHEYNEDVLKCLERMEVEGICPDNVTYLCSLKACGLIGAKDKGTEIYSEISIRGLFEKDILVGNALIDMYAKCGSLLKAQELFDKLPCRDIFSWNSLISGYAQTGESKQVFVIFDRMREGGNQPDAITFVLILNVCSHLGLIAKGTRYFEAMSKDFGIDPTLQHHTCMIDLLAHVGHLDEAQSVLKKLPFYPDSAVWHSILSACWKSGNMELGKITFEYKFKERQNTMIFLPH